MYGPSYGFSAAPASWLSAAVVVVALEAEVTGAVELLGVFTPESLAFFSPHAATPPPRAESMRRKAMMGRFRMVTEGPSDGQAGPPACNGRSSYLREWLVCQKP